MAAVGKGLSAWGHWWEQSAKARSASPGKGPFSLCLWCCSSWLLLRSSWQSAQENTSKLWRHMLQRNMPAFKSALSCCFCTSLCGLSQLPRGPCLTCAPAPPFSFFLTVGKPKAHFPGSCWHNPLCKPLSSLNLCPGYYGIAVWFLQEYTNRNRARHYSRRGWALDMATLQETAAADAVLCCEQLVFISYVIAETRCYH